MSDVRSLDTIFKPRSIAVIGATPRRGTIGQQLVHNIIEYGFNGTLFPVNPNYDFIHSIKCYPSVLDVPDRVDLAIIVVPKGLVAAVADECGRKGVKGLVVISAGFGEVGGDGVAREAELMRLKKKYGFRIVGPNCMGVISAIPSVRMNAAFAPLQPQSGSLALMTQSGALGVAVLLEANKLNLGLSYFVSVGNKADIGGNDLLEYWAAEDNTKTIALYLESFGSPRRFTALAKQITRHKPILVVKSGRTAAGARAASSHTGALAGMEIAVEALLHQCGVIRVSSIEELMNLALAYSRTPVPHGDRIAIVTNAGGPGIMATDALVSEGLQMAEFSESTTAALKGMLPAEASLRNPVDMIASATPAQYEQSLQAILGDDGVDAAIAIFVPPIMTEPREVVEKVAAVAAQFDKSVFMVLMAEDKYFEELPYAMPTAPPLYRFPESAVQVVAGMRQHQAWCERPEGRVAVYDVPDRATAAAIVSAQASAGGGYLSPTDVARVLEVYGFPVCAVEVVAADGDPKLAGDRIGYPLVLKAHGQEIIHKSDFGGVVTGIADAAALDAARAAILASLAQHGMREQLDGFTVQEMARPGKEVILGMTTDDKFGPILMFGMGGKYVEITKDIAFRVMPVTDVDAAEMVREIKSYPILEGVRGDERVDIEFIVDAVQRLAQMVEDLPQIAELDMNPVIVHPAASACRVVDARIRIAAS